MRIIYKIGKSLLLISLLSGYANAAAPTNKELKIGITQEFENLNPIVSQMAATSFIFKAVGRLMVDMDAAGKWYPSIIKEIPTIQNGGAKIVGEGKDKKIIAEWEIRENAIWGDGIPITGEDVKFTWTVALSKNVSVGEREIYSQVEKIEVDPKNPKKFVTTYEKTKWDFNRLLQFAVIPSHLEAPIFSKFSEQNEGYAKNSLYVKDATNPGLYCGPFVIKEIKLGSHVTLERNPKFFGTAAKIEKIIIKLIPDTGTLEANLRSGNIDMIGELGLPFDQAVSFEKKIKADNLPFQMIFKPSLVFEHIDLQLNNPILKDRRVRKALVYAINRKDLTDALFEGKQQPAIHNIAPMDPWYTADPSKIVTYEHSKRKAEKLLNEAGWLEDKSGVRLKEGKRLALQIMTRSGDKTRELVETYLQDQWKKIGVAITIKNEPARVFFGETVRKGQYSGMAMYAWISIPENTPRAALHSSSIPTEKNGFSGQNSMGWSNPEVDKLIENLEMEFDAKKRIDLSTKILHFYTEEVPVIPLYYRSDIAVLPANMIGLHLNGHLAPSTNHVEFWELK